MKNALRLCVAIALSVSAASPLLAQSPPPNSGPPKVLQILREEVKAGRAAAHQKWETGWPRAFAKANWPTNYLTVVSVTGPSEAWFMTGYESFAAWGKDTEALDRNVAFKTEYDRLSEGDAQFLSGGRSIVGAFREDLSTPVPVVLPKMRYFRVLTFRIGPGHEIRLRRLREDDSNRLRKGERAARVGDLPDRLGNGDAHIHGLPAHEVAR